MSENMRTRRAAIAGMGAAAAAAMGARPARAQGASGGFRPMRHPEDSWLDQRPGKHRIFIDAATPHGAGEAILFANNVFSGQKDGYAGGADGDLAVVVCLRHFATAFAFTDAVWAKYGKALSSLLDFTDPKTKQAPATNLYNSADYGMSLPTLGRTIAQVTQRGAYFAVCNGATNWLATNLAQPMASTQEAIYKDLVANLIPNSRLVYLGVMAVTRAQEYDYSLLYAG